MSNTLAERVRNLTLLRDADLSVLYDRAAISLRPIPSMLADTWSQLLTAAAELPEDSPLWPDVAALINGLLDTPLDNPLAGVSLPERDEKRAAIRRATPVREYLNKLALNIANDCNLACTYCYANEGLY